MTKPTGRKRLAAMHTADLESERQWVEAEIEHLGLLALEGEPVGTVVAQYQADLDAIMAEIQSRLRAKTLPRGGTRPSFDRAFIESVKAATDIVDLVQASGTPLEGAGTRWHGRCPFHDDHDPSLTVYRDQGRWHCYGACQTGGDVVAWIMQRQGMEFVSAIEFLAEHVGLALPTRAKAPAASGPAPGESPTTAGPDILFEGRPTTDMANGRRFAVLNRDKARYLKGWGWVIYTGRHWERNELAAMVLARAVVQSIYAEAAQLSGEKARMARGRHAFSTESLHRRKAMLESARSEPEMKATPEDFDKNGWLFNCANGTLDLKTGELRPHAASDMLTKLAPVSFDGDAELGHWKRHIEYFLANADVRRYVQRQLGRSLVGEHLTDELPIWHGEGANGRSTAAMALRKLLGDYCDTAPPKLLLASRHERHPTELADLYGSRLLFSIEIDEGSRLAEAVAKQLTGGDRVKGRFVRQDFFSFDPTWTIILVVNQKPEIRTGGHATWRRIKLVPWTITMPDAEQRAQAEVVAELVEDGAAVLRWLLEGLADWQADPHWCPDEVVVATKTYRAEEDPLREWVAECCVLAADAWASAKDLRASYETWGSENGIGPRGLVSGTKWGKALRARGCRRERQYVGTRRTRGWLGIELRDGTDGTDGTDSAVLTQASLSHEGYTEHPVPSVPPLAQGELVHLEGAESVQF